MKNTLTFSTGISQAGYYRIGDLSGEFRFYLTKKPKWFHRICMRMFLGFKWIDE